MPPTAPGRAPFPIPLPTMRLALLLALLVTAAPATAQLTFEEAFPNLPGFTRPVDLETPGDGRFYVVEQAGVIESFRLDPTASEASTFLDITGRVDDVGNEEGLLGLAFHPDYADNGYFYVNYTASGPNRSVISRFSRSAANPTQADPASEVVLLEVSQPFSNHNGGDLAFGPDGHLYVALGDGGSGGDPGDRGQDTGTLLGKLLRLDVDGGGSAPDCGGASANYTVPDNALADGPGGACDEIFAYGLRNPWRFSFDRETGELWAGDVGQSAQEEIDLIANGDNLGWDVMEGTLCFDPDNDEPPCNDPSLTDPVWVYGRSLGFSVTGGFVYRGPDVPELLGRYVYADFGSGRIWALDDSGAEVENEQLFDTNLNIATFGEDTEGELYFTAFNGQIYRFRSTTTGAAPGAPGSPPALAVRGPNPFRGRTEIEVAAGQTGPARVRVFDLLGREVRVLYEGMLRPGQAERVPFEAGALPAGLYIVRLEAGGETVTRKVVLAR